MLLAYLAAASTKQRFVHCLFCILCVRLLNLCASPAPYYVRVRGFFMQLGIFNRSTPVSKTHKTPKAAHRLHIHLHTLLPIFGLLIILLIWELITRMELFLPFIVPRPGAVWDKFLIVLADGRLWYHTMTTLGEIFAGLLIGVPLGVILGYLLWRSKTLEILLSPLILAAQSTPVVAYAPILIIWFGTGTSSKVFICALIVFFPMLMNTLVGLRNVPVDQRELMSSLYATQWQTLQKLEFPASMPVLFGGLKVSATLAVVGAVVGEFLSANAGLGFWIKLSRDQYDTPLVAVSVIMLAVLARLMYALVSLAERHWLHWQRT